MKFPIIMTPFFYELFIIMKCLAVVSCWSRTNNKMYFHAVDNKRFRLMIAEESLR